MADVAGPRALQAAHDAGALDWMLEILGRRRWLGSLQRVLVREPGGAAVGGYVYGLNRRGLSQVVVLAARPRRSVEILRHMFHHAWSRGAVALTGRASATLLPALGETGCTLRREGGWVLAHSRRPELLAALHQGQEALGRLDGEWWLGF